MYVLLEYIDQSAPSIVIGIKKFLLSLPSFHDSTMLWAACCFAYLASRGVASLQFQLRTAMIPLCIYPFKDFTLDCRSSMQIIPIALLESEGEWAVTLAMVWIPGLSGNLLLYSGPTGPG